MWKKLSFEWKKRNQIFNQIHWTNIRRKTKDSTKNKENIFVSVEESSERI